MDGATGVEREGAPVPTVSGPLGPEEQPTPDRFRWMVETVGEVIFEADPNGIWTYLNPAWTHVLGYEVADCIGKPFLEFVHPDDRQANLEIFVDTVMSGKDRCRFEARYLTANGGVRTLEIHAWIFRAEDGSSLGSTGTLTDVTERRRTEAILEHRAAHDSLTGLPNRSRLVEKLVAVLEACGERQEPVALLFLDLDRFKLVNDGVGHDAGDEVLNIVAVRLQRAGRPGDIVARFGGDEFVIVSPGLDQAGARELAGRLRAAVAAPMNVQGRELTTTVSVGIRVHTPANHAGLSALDLVRGLLRDADSAMYEAKESGRDRASTFDLSTRHRIVERLETESLLRRAVERGELELHYQPQLSLRTGTAIGAEALVRWNHPMHGMVGPATFIPIAEESGLIGDIGLWVMEQACAVLAPGGPLHGQRISINASPRQLANGLVADVAGVLARTGAEPSNLCIELTETALMADADSARSSMTGLADLGVRLSLDDFGTGFSSLSLLQRLPLVEVKIDRSFIARLGTGDGRAVVAAIIGMADALGLETVAEGVEVPAEADLLVELGCTLAQGYLYAPPMPMSEVVEALSTQRS